MKERKDYEEPTMELIVKVPDILTMSVDGFDDVLDAGDW